MTIEQLREEGRIICAHLPVSIADARDLIAKELLIIKDDWAREELKQALQHGHA